MCQKVSKTTLREWGNFIRRNDCEKLKRKSEYSFLAVDVKSRIKFLKFMKKELFSMARKVLFNFAFPMS